MTASNVRGIRNNNPGNIRWGDHWRGLVSESQRTDKAFCQFVNAEYGIRAMMIILNHYHTQHGLNTLDGIIRRWAPPEENNTQAYIDGISTVIRLSALKDYEDSELVAARIAAALGMYIKKGDGQDYSESLSDSSDRELTIQPGMLFDGLQPGEDVGMIKSDRPNTNLESFRNGQLRAVAAGTRLSFSSTARNYNGTYSAQRQELVESTDGYRILQDSFIAAVTRPVYRAWLKQAVAAGVIRLSADVDMPTLCDAIYSGPGMPWIDPVKEATAWRIQIRGGAATESDWARACGRNPDEVKRRRKAEIDENLKEGLVFDTDPANDKGVNSERKNDAAKPDNGGEEE